MQYQDPRRYLCPCYSKLSQCLVAIGCSMKQKVDIFAFCTRKGYCKDGYCAFRAGDLTPRIDTRPEVFALTSVAMPGTPCVDSCCPGQTTACATQDATMLSVRAPSRAYRREEVTLLPRQVPIRRLGGIHLLSVLLPVRPARAPCLSVSFHFETDLQSHIQPAAEQRVEIAHNTTLLKTRLLSNEKIVAEFIEKPVGKCCWDAQIVRHVQLTTHRVNYSEVFKKNCCWSAPPSLRQVFLKDISEISVDNYRRVDESWLKKILNILLRVGCPIAGVALIIYDSVDNSGIDGYGDYTSSNHTKRWIGIVLLVVRIIAIILSLCRKKAPRVIFGTRCPQMPAFSITLTNASDRVRLLEEVTTLIAKHQ